jgi:methyl-accepting chemotaxis protein
MQIIDNMTLKTRMVLLTVVMVIGLVFLSYKGLMATTEWTDNVYSIGKKESVQGMSAIRMDRERITVRAQTLSVYEFQGNLSAGDKLKGILEARAKSWDKFEKDLKIYQGLTITEAGKKGLEDFLGKYKKWRDVYVGIDATILEIANCKDLKAQEALYAQYKAKVGEMVGVSDSMGAALGELVKRRETTIAKVTETAYEEASSYKTSILIVACVILLLSIALAAIIISSTNKTIVSAVETINEGAMQISDASDQVASSSTSLAQGASEQASSVEEVSATLEESSAAVASNTENTRQADILAKQANISAKEGLIKGNELVVSMKEVSESAVKIANIVKTIDQIAFQVNLLALNAAVEAARAGEHGLGFAVVADEVRNLAQRAANSAKETGVVIEEAVTQIKKGSNIAQLASDSFRDIEDKSKKVSDLIGEVALSSREQAEAVGQLNMAMAQIDQVTQQVAANSEEAAAASEELNAQAATALEAIAGLAKIVGLDMKARKTTKAPTRANRPAGMVTGNRPKIAMKSHTGQPTARRGNDDVFPLSENDLKEF